MRLTILSALLFLLSLPATAQVNEPADVPLTEAERRELQVVERFWTLLERTPRRGTSFDRVYGYYVDTGRMEDLLKRCRDWTEAQPDDAKAWLLLGLILARRNDDAATVAAFEKAMALDETDLLAPFYLGETYIAQGRLRDSAETLEIALERALENNKGINPLADRAVLSRDTLAILQTLGRVYERFSDRENSNRVWDKLEELFPGDKDILVRIAETLEEEGKFDEAFKRYRRLAEMPGNDNFARVQYTLAAADIKVRLGDKQGAIEDFETLLEELSGDNWLSRSIRDRVERIFVRQADYAGLAGYYQKRLQRYPNDLDTIRRHAVALVRLARTDEAKELLANTLERAPSNVPIRLALIDLLVADRDFEAVDQHYAKIDELEPNNPDHISQWGLAVLENTKLDEPARKASAIQIWSRLITARPDDPAILIMVADLANGAKIADEAEKLYKRATELRPNDPGYKEYLGYFYHHRDRKEEAVATLRSIADGNRRTAPVLAQLGGIFRSLGYAEEALTAMNEAVELDPENFELRMQYADLLFTNDKIAEAETHYAEAEKLARPLTEEFARFLNAYTRLLQSTGKLNEVANALAVRLVGEGSESRLLSPEDAINVPPPSGGGLGGGQDAVVVQSPHPSPLPKGEGTERAASDYWRLATYQTAQGQLWAATESIEKAMELAPETNILLDSAAAIFEKGNDQVRAAAIYEKLANADPQRRVEHLKRLANLRRDLGEMDQAIETARLVMATGAGNAANSRFYADMLLSIGRRGDGIDILRRAVRLDPTDTTTLTTLAEVLFDTNEINEALEIQWRIFERTEDLQGKIGVVTRMSTYYQQSQRFDQLIERLRQIGNDSASRRESAYCLAQAYVTVSDFELARQTLETLLLGTDDKETDDTLLLSQLSRISELQGDIPTAIRYQEMLCDRLQGGPQAGQENERLLSLYQQSGEKEKAIEHLLKFFVEKGDLREQVQAMDDLLAREDYESVKKILDRIEGKHPRSWEILYRRLMLEFWQDDLESATISARRILALDTPRDELSAKRQHATQQTTATALTPQQQRSAQMFGSGYQPWGFGQHQGYSSRGQFVGGMGLARQQNWQAAHAQMFPVFFRDRLQLEQYFYQRGSMSGTSEPPKPQWEPETFGDARFAAAAWLLRIAMQEDINAFRESHSAEEAPVIPAQAGIQSEDDSVIPAQAGIQSEELQAARLDSGLRRNDVPSRNDGSAPPAPTAANGLTLDRFTEAVDAWRSSAPADAADVARIEERLRMEYFFQQWLQTVQQAAPSFPEGDYAALLFTFEETADGKQQTAERVTAVVPPAPVVVYPSSTVPLPLPAGVQIQPTLHGTGIAAAQTLRTQLEFRLAMMGEKEWLPAAYSSIIRDIASDQVSVLQRFDLGKEFDQAVENAPAAFRERVDAAEIAFARQSLPRLFEMMQKMLGRGGPDSLSVDQKVDLIFQCWQLALDSSPENNAFQMVIPTYPSVLAMFKQLGREQDAVRLETLVERAAEANPLIDAMIARIMMFSPARADEQRDFLMALRGFKHFVEELGADVMMEPDMSDIDEEEMMMLGEAFEVLDALMETTPVRAAAFDFDGQFAAFQSGIERMKRAAARISAMPQPMPTSSGMMRSAYVEFSSPEMMATALDQMMSQYLERVIASVHLVVGGNVAMHGMRGGVAYVQRGGGMVPVMMANPAGVPQAAPAEKIKITPEQFVQLTAAEKEVYRLLDYYFEQMNELGGGRQAAGGREQTADSRRQTAVAAQRRPTPPSLLSYRQYFERNQQLRGYDLQNILHGGLQQSGISVQQMMRPEMTLMTAQNFFKMLDEQIEVVAEEVAAEEVAHRPPGDGSAIADREPPNDSAAPQSAIADDAARRSASYLSRFNAYLDAKATDGTDGDKARVENLRTLLAAQAAPHAPQQVFMTGVAMNAMNDAVNADEVIKELEAEEKELTDNNAGGGAEKLDFRKVFVLALLHRQKDDTLKAVEYLDALPLTGSGDIRYREQLMLQWFASMSNDAAMRKRAETAAQRLLGYQLNGSEMQDLRQALRLLDRNDEADRIRDRMLATVTDLQTQRQLLQELRNDPNTERTVQFALKVYRSPAVRNAGTARQGDFARSVRDMALDILQRNGKLDEIVEQIEAQWRSSPTSLDIMVSLADIYNKAGRRDEAQKIAREIGEKIPDDAARMTAHANLLRNLGMNNEAAEWTMKALAKNPEQILQNFWQHEESFRNSNQIPALIAILKQIPPQRLAQQYGNISHRMTEWQRNAATKEAADELLDYIWAMEGASDAERRQGRANFVRTLSSNAQEVHYPMFHEVMFDAVAVLEPATATTGGGAGVIYAQPVQQVMSPFAVYSWGQDRVWSSGNAFFDLAEKKDILEETKKEFQKAVEAHEAMEAEQRHPAQYLNARLALAVNEIRLKNADAAVEILEALVKEESEATAAVTARRALGGEYQLILGLELATLEDHPAAVELAIQFFEEVLKNSQGQTHVERVVFVPLNKLYLKTNQAEKGRAMALEKLRECFHYLKLMGNQSYYQVGNSYYQSHSLQESAVATSRLLIDSDNAFDVMIVFREMYDGQPWVNLQRQQQNYRLRELDSISQELEGKISAKDYTEKLERLIPGMSGNEEEGKETDIKTALPMTLGRYIIPVKLPEQPNRTPMSAAAIRMLEQMGIMRQTEVPLPADSEESLAGIRLADSLAVIAEEDADRYAALKTAIEALGTAAPEDPTVLIALTSCRLIDGDHDAVAALLRRAAEWSKDAGDVDQQIHLGFWSVLKSTFAEEALMAMPQVRADVETLFQFTGRLVGLITVDANEERRTQLTGFSTPVYSFLLDVQRRTPEELYQKFQPDVDAKVYERILLPAQGRLTPNLATQRNQIAEQLSEGVAIAPAAVMQAFRTAFANGHPPVEGGGQSRENSMFLLFVFGRVLEAAKAAEVEPVIVYEALRDIVLPKSERRSPFLAEYNDLGGENGYFRTPAADLVDWAVAAERVDDLKERIAAKRAHPDSEARLDAVELLLALKTEDTGRSAELIARFLEGVRADNPQVSMFAAMAATPAAKPFEFSEITEHYPALIELIDALIVSESEAVKDARGRRYAYYMVRSFYDRFEKEAAIPQRTAWLRHYKGVAPLNQMDGFLFASEDRLYHEGLAAIEADKLDDAVAVLRFFAAHNADHFRYRDLTEYLEKLQPKVAALNEAERQTLLGDFNLSTVARQSSVRRAEDTKLTAKPFDLPPLPEGTIVYQNDFEKQVGSEWSIDRRDTMPGIDKTFLGEFHSERVRLYLTDLPEHRFVRIRFELLTLAGMDGLVGYPREFGVDVWGMEITGGGDTPVSRPMVSSFSCFHNDPNGQTQSFPDDYPLEFGFQPAWFSQLVADRLWTYNNEDHGKGVYHGRHGADVEKKFGYEVDAAYAIDLIVPHSSPELSIEFFTKFQDGPFGHGHINLALGECWGLDNIQIETIDKALELDEAALKQCFDALLGNDAAKAGTARWRLVAAENASVEYIARWFKDESNAAKRSEIQRSDNFDLFRINRVLELIATPEAEVLRKEIKP